MLILALETTSAHGSLALMRDDRLLSVRDLDAGSYSVQVLPVMLETLAEAGFQPSQIDAFAVANGPGSFTGIRIGLTVIKALVEAWKRPAVAISTLSAVAAAVNLEADAPVLAALDASRAEVYTAAYPSAPGLDRFAVNRTQFENELLQSTEALLEQLRSAPTTRLLSPHPNVLELARTVLPARNVVEIERRLAPAVGRIGAYWLGQGASANALELDANYIRRSDAEIFSLPRLVTAAQLAATSAPAATPAPSPTVQS